MRDGDHEIGAAVAAPETNDPQDRADPVLQTPRPVFQRLKARIAISGVMPDVGTQCPEGTFPVFIEDDTDVVQLLDGRQARVVDQRADVAQGTEHLHIHQHSFAIRQLMADEVGEASGAGNLHPLLDQEIDAAPGYRARLEMRPRHGDDLGDEAHPCL